MAVDSTERWEYVKAKCFTYFGGLTLTGTPAVVYEGQERERPDENRFFVRFGLRPVNSLPSGHYDATHTATRQAFFIVADVYGPSGEESASYDAYAVDRVASEIESAGRDRDLPFTEYSTPAAPTVVDSTLIHFFTATRRERRMVDGFDHIQVLIDGRWFVNHATA